MPHHFALKNRGAGRAEGYSPSLTSAVHFIDERRNRLVEIPAVNLRKQSSHHGDAESLCFHHPSQLRLRPTELLKVMVVMHRRPQKAPHPFPIAVRVEFGHLET